MRVNARPWHLLLTSLVAIACGDPTADADEPTQTSRHGLFTIERTESLEGAETSGNAFAGIVEVSSQIDPALVLRLAGLGLDLPAAGQCAAPTRGRDAVPQQPLGAVEFLDAGVVSIRALAAETPLAPRAFPAVTDLVSGVVYSSRDRRGEVFPSGDRYRLAASGSAQLQAVEVSVDAPEALSELEVAELPVEAVVEVATDRAVPLRWRSGDARDIVYVEVLDAAAHAVGVCAFQDSAGHGELPAGVFGANGAGTLSFHRLREVAAATAALDSAEVRFDFEVTRGVSFVAGR